METKQRQNAAIGEELLRQFSAEMEEKLFAGVYGPPLTALIKGHVHRLCYGCRIEYLTEVDPKLLVPAELHTCTGIEGKMALRKWGRRFWRKLNHDKLGKQFKKTRGKKLFIPTKINLNPEQFNPEMIPFFLQYY